MQRRAGSWNSPPGTREHPTIVWWTDQLQKIFLLFRWVFRTDRTTL